MVKKEEEIDWLVVLLGAIVFIFIFFCLAIESGTLREKNEKYHNYIHTYENQAEIEWIQQGLEVNEDEECLEWATRYYARAEKEMIRTEHTVYENGVVVTLGADWENITARDAETGIEWKITGWYETKEETGNTIPVLHERKICLKKHQVTKI